MIKLKLLTKISNKMKTLYSNIIYKYKNRKKQYK